MVASAHAMERRFRVNGVELDQVKVFKYLDQLLTPQNADSQAMRVNLVKARRVWAWFEGYYVCTYLWVVGMV